MGERERDHDTVSDDGGDFGRVTETNIPHTSNFIVQHLWRSWPTAMKRMCLI